MKTKNFITLVLITLGVIFISCGGGSDSSSSTSSLPTTITGIFIDDPVEGLNYECSSGTTGVTNQKGEFICKIGDNITFYMGNILLGEAYSSREITPYTLFPKEKDAAINLVRLLHSIDKNSTTGVLTIDKNIILPSDLNFSSVSFDDDISSFIMKPLIGKNEATLLLNNNLGVDASNEIYHNGFGYNTIVSSVTGRVWLDRDLGAKSVCSDYNDTSCYGEFYQWGRDTDGHEKQDSQLSYSYPSDIDNAGNKFVIDTLDWIGYDSNGSRREKKWASVDGSSVCPVNFRVPTKQEFLDENILVANFTLTNELTQEETVTNVLKLATAGERDLDRGVVKEGEMGTYWTGESYKRVVGGSWQYSIFPYTKYGSGRNYGYEGTRAIGKNVRCIMEEDIVHNGVSYKIIKSPYTDRFWLDRNLGASRACLYSTDSACYGDYYQWGRDNDGHEKFNSQRSTVQEINYVNNSDKFVLPINATGDWTTSDVSGELRVAKWSKTDGTSVCPIGFRVPTMEEILADTATPGWIIIAQNPTVQHAPYPDFLKLSYSGYRSAYGEDKFVYIDIVGNLWSTSFYKSGDIYYDGYISYFRYTYYSANTQMTNSRASGINIRCIKD